jgi:hypothetical protein
LLQLILYNNVNSSEQYKEWCWTLPDLKVKIEADKFGYNWGHCIT